MGPPPQDNDRVLAEKLRREDPEQYHTLIRMHLSFVLDLHTDECDSGTEKVKSRVLKWNLLPFSKKSKTQAKGVMEGAPLTQEGICQVYQLIEFLAKEQSIQQEGIFRRSGKLRRQQELKSLLNQGVSLDLNDGCYSVHDCASVLKNFLAELPEPLLTDAHYQAHCQIAEMCISGAEGKSDGRLLRALQLLLLLLPPENRVLLSDLLGLLHLTANHQASNRMSAESLATLFTPHLACPRKMPPEALHANAQLMSRVIAFMIRQGASSLFQIPPQLATDIRAYWARKEVTGTHPCKKVDSRNLLKGETKGEGESAEVNTVFSFVDRERTAQAHNSNITEAALAQLYAHIRSLPESSEKRRLVKQFNKENGLGTPHQHYTRVMATRGKSLGDSIKKHLFNKGMKCTKSGTHQGYFNVLQQSGADKSNNPEHTLTPRLMMFQKSMDELSPLSKAYSHLYPPSSTSSGDKEEPPSQRKLNFSDSSEKSSSVNQDDVYTNPKDNSKRLKTNIKQSEEDITITSQDAKNESSVSHFSDEHNRQSKSEKFETNLNENPCGGENISQVNFHSSIKSKDSNFLSPFKQPLESETNNWLQGPNVSPLPSAIVPGRQEKPLDQDMDLVTSTPASYRHRYPTRLRTRSNIETSLLYRHSSCMLTPVTSDENNSMSPITRSTQKMSKAMQETMMTPRSRKPVLALSGSNISHVPSLNLCSQIQTDKNVSTSATVGKNKKESPSEAKDSTGRDSVSLSLDHGSTKTNENDKSCSDSKDENSSSDDDSDSLTSTFINYLESRSVLTASPIDLSSKEESRPGSPVTLDLVSLKSENQLSDSLLYCLDGNVPSTSPSPSFATQEMDKSPCDSLDASLSTPESQRRPRKRKSLEMQKEGLNESTSRSHMMKLAPQKTCNSLDSTEPASVGTPKNKPVFETSL